MVTRLVEWQVQRSPSVRLCMLRSPPSGKTSTSGASGEFSLRAPTAACWTCPPSRPWSSTCGGTRPVAQPPGGGSQCCVERRSVERACVVHTHFGPFSSTQSRNPSFAPALLLPGCFSGAFEPLELLCVSQKVPPSLSPRPLCGCVSTRAASSSLFTAPQECSGNKVTQSRVLLAHTLHSLTQRKGRTSCT
jgi:hypothetical protein